MHTKLLPCNSSSLFHGFSATERDNIWPMRQRSFSLILAEKQLIRKLQESWGTCSGKPRPARCCAQASFWYLNTRKENWQEFVFTTSVGYGNTTPAKTQSHCSCLTYIHELHIGFWTSGLIKDLNGHRNLHCFTFRDPDPLGKKKKKVDRRLIRQKSEKLDSELQFFLTHSVMLCRLVMRCRTETT